MKRSANFLRGQGRENGGPASKPRPLDVGLGKVPPQAIELEEAVLGALMIEKDALTAVVDILKPETFYKDAHQRIYNAIYTLFKNSEPVDMLTVVNQLRQTAEIELVGGAYYISSLTNRVNSAANIEFHARIVVERAIKRALITAASEVLRDAYEDTNDVFQLLDRTEQSLFTISESNIRKNYEKMSSLIRQAIEDLEKRALLKDGLTGVPTGFSNLDRVTSGWQKSDLVILAARPGMGKTAFVVSAMRNAAVDFGKAVAIFSLEMSSVQLVNRLISAEVELESEKIKKGNLQKHEWEQLHHKIGKLENAPIFIDDTPALSILELRAKCRRLKQQHDIELIIIDYLQLMTGDSSGKLSGNREQEIASISRALKNLAKELNVPVIALSQLSRAVETRGGDKRPQLSDLRESGCVTGDTLVFNPETGERIPIKQLAERDNARQPVPCLAVDGHYRLRPHPMVNAFYSGRKPVFELTTRSGRTIKASANHPFLKLGGWARLDALRVGDSIAVPRQLAATNPTNPLSEDELTLLAHLLGDGCILPRQPYHYTSADDENITAVAQTAARLFGIQARVVPQGNWSHVYLPAPYRLTHGVRHPITNWYENLGLDRVRSYDKQLPDAIFRCDDHRLALFLKHLWATDGNISWKKGTRTTGVSIYYGTSSRLLAQQVHHLLLRLGILASLKTVASAKGHRPMHHLHVSGKTNQLRFLREIGCFGTRGAAIPTMVEHLERGVENLNYDVIPKEAWKLVVDFYKTEAGMSWRGIAAGLGGSYCGDTLFKSGISRRRMQRLHDVLPFAMLKNLAESDVLWDQVVAVTPLGEADVYDATVAEVHNFVANDFIIHNSIEQDADMVLFLYRPEYYGLTDDGAGNSTAGLGEVIIAKHRNGSLDTVPLRFIGKFTKFADFDAAELRPLAPNGGFAAGTASQEFGSPTGTITLGSKVNEPMPPFGTRPATDEPPF